MKVLTILCALTVASFTYAGPGHKHGHSHGHSHASKVIEKEKTLAIGKYHVERLVKAGKIDASWKVAKYDDSVKKKFKNKTEWVVTFNNEKGVKGKKLYIFLKLTGEFVAANFSGK